MSRGSDWRVLAGIGIVLPVLFASPLIAWADDLIVVRPKLPLQGKSVQGFDPDGVRLVGGSVLAWEEIESARLDRDQARFNAMLTDVGEPLFHLARGLRSADYPSLLEPAERVWPVYADRRSKEAFLAALGLMWGRLAHGQREAAVEPCLVLLDIQKRARERLSTVGPRRLVLDLNAGLSPELPPVFLNARAAEAALPGARKAAETLGMPGGWLLVASLELAAGQGDAAGKTLARLGKGPRDVDELRRVLEARKWRLLGQADRAREAVGDLPQTGLDATRPLARLALGEALVGSPVEADRRNGVIDLLYLPAIDADTHPDLAALALDLAARTLEALHDPEAKLLRKDLRDRFPDQAARFEAGPND